MSDEQIRLLQQILEVQKEQLAFARNQRDEFMAVQQTALAGQKKGLRMSRFVIAFMLIAVGAIVLVAILSPAAPDLGKPVLSPEQRARAGAQ